MNHFFAFWVFGSRSVHSYTSYLCSFIAVYVPLNRLCTRLTNSFIKLYFRMLDNVLIWILIRDEIFFVISIMMSLVIQMKLINFLRFFLNLIEIKVANHFQEVRCLLLISKWFCSLDSATWNNFFVVTLIQKSLKNLCVLLSKISK